MSSKNNSDADFDAQFDEKTVELETCTVKLSINDFEIIPDKSDTTHTVKWIVSLDGDVVIRNPYDLDPLAKGEVLLMWWSLVENGPAPGLGVAVDELDITTEYLYVNNRNDIGMLAMALDQIEDQRK